MSWDHQLKLLISEIFNFAIAYHASTPSLHPLLTHWFLYLFQVSRAFICFRYEDEIKKTSALTHFVPYKPVQTPDYTTSLASRVSVLHPHRRVPFKYNSDPFQRFEFYLNPARMLNL